MDLENPKLKRWVDGITNCWGVTDEYKQELILDYARRFNLTTFVETGTWHGDTVEHVWRHFNHSYSIELSPELFTRAQQRFVGVTEVTLLLGDSGVVLNELLARLSKTPMLFWLDAHPSGGDTVGNDSPLERELTAILENGCEGVILIDDLQDFWDHGWDDVARRTIAKYAGWQQEIKHGIMRVIHAS